jgi:hypothetical protein
VILFLVGAALGSLVTWVLATHRSRLVLATANKVWQAILDKERQLTK